MFLKAYISKNYLQSSRALVVILGDLVRIVLCAMFLLPWPGVHVLTFVPQNVLNCESRKIYGAIHMHCTWHVYRQPERFCPQSIKHSTVTSIYSNLLNLGPKANVIHIAMYVTSKYRG